MDSPVRTGLILVLWVIVLALDGDAVAAVALAAALIASPWRVCRLRTRQAFMCASNPAQEDGLGARRR